jgi:hypothetical protein
MNKAAGRGYRAPVCETVARPLARFAGSRRCGPADIETRIFNFGQL